MIEITIELEKEDLELLRTEYGCRTGEDDHLIGESDDIIITRVLKSVINKLKSANESCITCKLYFSGKNCNRIKKCDEYVDQKTK